MNEIEFEPNDYSCDSISADSEIVDSSDKVFCKIMEATRAKCRDRTVVDDKEKKTYSVAKDASPSPRKLNESLKKLERLKTNLCESWKVICYERKRTEKEMKQFRDEMMHCQVENERLELDIRSKLKEIKKLKAFSVSAKGKEICDETK